jgi:hypothetical protein
MCNKLESCLDLLSTFTIEFLQATVLLTQSEARYHFPHRKQQTALITRTETRVYL